jgi:hypothetical protein
MGTQKVTAELADRLARKIQDNRDQPDWEQSLWEELQWLDDLDTKQVDILFGMIVSRWDRAKRARGQDAAAPCSPEAA